MAMNKTSVFRVICGAGVVAMAATASAQTDPVIYDNGVVGNTGLSSQNEPVYPFDSQVADDFSLGGDFNITGVSWSGLYFNDDGTGPNSSSFNVFIYADDGAGTGPSGLPGTELAGFSIDISNVTVTNTGVLTEDYSADFGGSFAATAGTTYWIAIQSEGLFPPQWGWGGNNGGGNAVQGFPLLGTAYWTPIAPGTEMVFALNGTPVPAPGALAMLGLGGLVAGRRRRN